MQKLPYACFPIILTSSERCSKDIWQKWQLVWMLFILGKFESDIPCQHKAKLSVFMVCTILKTSWILEVVLKIWIPWIRLRSLKSTYFLYYSLGPWKLKIIWLTMAEKIKIKDDCPLIVFTNQKIKRGLQNGDLLNKSWSLKTVICRAWSWL